MAKAKKGKTTKAKTTKKAAPEPTTVNVALTIGTEDDDTWTAIVEAVTDSLGTLVTDDLVITLTTAAVYDAALPVDAVEPDEEDDEPEDDDEEEPEDEEEEDEEDEEDEDEEEEEEGEGYDREELEEMNLRELRALAREEGYDRDDVKGLDSDSLIDLLSGEEGEEEDDEEYDEDEEEDDDEVLDEDDLAAMSVKELRALAKEYERTVPRGATKSDIIDLIMEAADEE